jgi:hypothetical protein
MNRKEKIMFSNTRSQRTRATRVTKWLSQGFILPVLCVVCIVTLWMSLYAQTPAKFDKTYNWIQSKMNDPEVSAALKNFRPKVDETCDPRSSAGFYDPVPCWEKQVEGLQILLSTAQKDPNAATIIRTTLQKELQRLRAIRREWASLPQNQKDERLRNLSTLVKALKKSADNVEKGLQQVINDPKEDQSIRELARRTLPGWNNCRLGCICFKAEGCPCCGYDTIILCSILGSCGRG